LSKILPQAGDAVRLGDDPAAQEESPTATRPPPAPRRGRRKAVALLLACIVAVAAGLAAAVLVAGPRIPDGVRIDGVDVGGLTPAAAERMLQRRAAEASARPVLVVGPRGSVRTSGAELGASPRVAAAVAEAGAERLGLFRNWLGFREEREVPLRWAVDRAPARAVAMRLGRPVPPTNASVVVDASGVHVRAAKPGRSVDLLGLYAGLRSLPAVLQVPTASIPPRVTTAEARNAARRVERLVGTPRTIVFGSSSTALQPSTLRALVSVRRDRGRLVVSFDPARLAALLPARTPPRDAALRVEGATVVVVPGSPGRALDATATARALAASDRATIRATVMVMPPSVTTAELARLGIRERISEFTTYYPPGQPRVVNIRRASAVIDGTILRSGATFSMNETLGERTIEKGYVPAPQIAGNDFVDSVGGGISQVATMLYNGAFFAGLELVEHQPHSLYIDRYPVGREATISWGGPELIFRNDWPAAVLIKLEATETSITVRFFSSALGRRVETETTVPNGHGGGGFSVEYTRRVYRGARLTRDEVYRVSYGTAAAEARIGGT
jgi:vancomycin resistance protein YoaR